MRDDTHNPAKDDAERKEIERLLKGGLFKGGLKTETHPRADRSEMVREIITRLRTSDGSLASRLQIAGFSLRPVEHNGVQQSCETCMYYAVHRRHCELPELDMAVEPRWSCRLWRI